MNYNDAQYQIYLDKVLQLASTIVIKSEDTVTAMNQYIASFYPNVALNRLDATTWRYYKHIAGEYHEIDTKMTVISLDTFEEIEFTVENLKIHRATARGYVYGTRYYLELVGRYPSQELLIKGIINPVNKQEAIDAPNGKILAYPKELVESNEYSFIEKLQTWIDAYHLRWYNQAFAISDNLYPATFLGIMYLQLMPAILAIRSEARFTNEAHSFYVRRFLTSHGIDNFYIDHLTKKQSLWFYRNLRYIERNFGTKETFKLLVKHIMTERNIPLVEYELRHDSKEQLETFYPVPMFRRKPLSIDYVMDSKDVITLDQLLLKEDDVARGNKDARLENTPTIYRALKNSLSNVLPTKVLESVMIDDTDSTPYTMEDTLLNMWIYMASKGLYRSIITVSNPKTGEYVSLNAKEAFVLYWYCYWMSAGVEFTTIPVMLATRVPKLPLPTAEELLKMVDTKYVSIADARAVLEPMAVVRGVISTEAYLDICTDVHHAANWQRSFIAKEEHYQKRGYLAGLVGGLYSDVGCSLADPNELYSTWFAERNLLFKDWKPDEYKFLADSILKEATGANLRVSNSLRDLQRAMVGLLRYLTSYSLQYLSEINLSRITTVDWAAIRVGDYSGLGGDVIAVETDPDILNSCTAEAEIIINYNPDPVEDDIPPVISGGNSLQVDHTIKPSGVGDAVEFLVRVPIGVIRPTLLGDLGLDSNGVPGGKVFEDLSKEEKAEFFDDWYHGA